MRAGALVVFPIALALLACTGSVDTPVSDEAGEEVGGGEDGVEEGEEGGKKKKRKKPGDGEDGEDGGDGGDGADDGGGGGGGGGAGPGPKPSPPPSSPPEGVEQVNATTWNVDKATKDKWMDDPGKLADAGRKGKGYQLSGIKSGSDAWHIGLRNGDIIKVVNGHSLATDAEAIAAYQALQSAKKLTVEMRRGEGPLTHTYNIK